MPRKSTPASRLGPIKGASAFRRKLLGWFDRAARDLPWRRTRDPYHVLVSEVMLQQTQVSRVTEYFPRFLARFPDLNTLARARPSAVREAWDGLGYYARARNLHALAKEVTHHYQGVVPSDPAQLIKLPGVGRYTAGAVASFAYERPVAAVDTNVARVIRRAFQGDGKATKGQAAKAVWDTATALVPRDGSAWRFNQAIMELGALVCVARRPRCPECPVRKECRTGQVAPIALGNRARARKRRPSP
ncbi:MAG TPA: A/G-specific adenine glycosylase [Gemmatimonadales bacterium]|nr:A/G-specific adenine glycosylase [Gemmatimonadales bacterium]